MSEDQFFWNRSGGASGKIDNSFLLAAIGQRNAILGSIFDILPFGIEVLECVRNSQNKILDFRFLYQNKFAQNLWTGNSLKDKTVPALLPGEPESGIFERLSKVVESGESEEMILPFSWGEKQIWIKAYSQKFLDGVMTSYKDITEQRLSEDKLQDTLGFIEQLSRSTPDIMYVFDRVEDKLTYVNSRASDILWKQNDEIHETEHEVFPGVIHDDDSKTFLKHLVECWKLTATEVKEIEIRLKVKSGEWKWFWIRNTVFKLNTEGNAIQLIGIGRDIHIQKMAELAMVKNHLELESLNAELRQFNSITGNDFKENLRKVYTSLEFIASNDARYLSNEGRANIRRTQSAVQKMRLLTDDISSYSELHEMEPNFSMVDPNEIIKKVLNKLREPIGRTGVRIEVMHFPMVYADSFMLSSLLFQLIDNAIKFRKQIIEPHIRIRYVQADEMNFDSRAEKDTPYGIISVSDNGIGLREHETEKIFDMFYKAEEKSKFKGLGIGLAICRRVMYVHNGFITAEGMPALGATFSCYFPLNLPHRGRE